MRVVRSKTIFLCNNSVNARAVFHGPSVEDAGPNETLRVVVKQLVLDPTARSALPADLTHVQLRSNLAGTSFEPFHDQLHASTILALAYRPKTFFFEDGGSDMYASALSTRHLDRVELRLCDSQGTVLNTAGQFDVVLRVEVVSHVP